MKPNMACINHIAFPKSHTRQIDIIRPRPRVIFLSKYLTRLPCPDSHLVCVINRNKSPTYTPLYRVVYMRKEDFEGQCIGVCACTCERVRVEVQVMGLYSLNHYHMALKPWANSDFLPSKVDWGRQEVGITLAWGEACFHCSSALLSHTHKHAHTAMSNLPQKSLLWILAELWAAGATRGHPITSGPLPHVCRHSGRHTWCQRAKGNWYLVKNQFCLKCLPTVQLNLNSSKWTMSTYKEFELCNITRARVLVHWISHCCKQLCYTISAQPHIF